MTIEDSHSNRKLVNMVSTTVYDAPAPKTEAAKDGESNAAGGSVPGLIMHMEESQMHDALLSPTVAQSEDSDNALESPYSYFNKHGVEIHWLTHKPLCCVTCAFFDLADVGEDEWPVPFCQRGVFMPVRKGTCVTRRPPALAAVPTEARS